MASAAAVATTTEVATVVLGAGAGAAVRYAAHEAYVRWHVHARGFAHPPLWGIAAVNIAASGLLGLLAANPTASRRRNLLLGTGFCGGLSTFSTFAVEAAKLAHSGSPRLCAAYVLTTNVGCLAAAALALRAGRRAYGSK